MNTLKIRLIKGYIDRGYIHIPSADKRFFPPAGTPFVLDTNVGTISQANNVKTDNRLEITGLKKRKWFEQNPELKEGDEVKFTAIVAMSKYKLQTPKEQKICFSNPSP